MLLKRLLWFACVATALLTSVDARAALSVSVEMGPDRVRPGESVNARITVANNGSTTVTGVALQAPVPVGIATFTALLLSQSSPGGAVTCTQNVVSNGLCDANEIINWIPGTIRAGESLSLSLAMPVGGATAAGTVLTLAASVQAGPVTGSASVTVANANALMLTIDESQDPIPAGNLLTYTLTYGNREPSAVTGTTLSFPLPTGTSFVSASGGGVFSAGSVQWTLGSLPSGQSGQQQVVVTVDGGLAAGSVLRVDAAVLSGTNAVAQATVVTAVGNPFLGLAVEVNPDPVRPGESGIAELTVTNRTSTDLTGVVLEVRIPQGLSPFNTLLTTSLSGSSFAGEGFNCIQAVPNGLCDSTELGYSFLSTIPAGGSVTVSIPIPVHGAASAGRLITLEANAIDDSSHQVATSQTLAVDSDNALNLAADEDVDPVLAGGVLTYTLTYANRGATPITGATLSFPVPAGTTFVSATGNGSFAGGRVQWALGSLPPTQSDQQQVVVAVDNGLAAGSPLIVDAALLSGTATAGLVENARATAATAVTVSPVLGLAVALRPDPVRAGEWAFAEITVTNRTLASLSPVWLQARMPQGLAPFNAALFTGVSTGCSWGAVDNALCDSSELANWNLGTIPAGGSFAVSLALPISALTQAGRLLTLEAVAREAASGYDSSHQSVTRDTLAVDEDSPLTLAVDQDAAPLAAGSLLTYTLTYGNRGGSSLTGTTLSFALPAQGVVAGSTGGTVSNGTLRWDLGNLAAGSGGRRKVFINIPAGLPAGSILRVDEAVLRGMGVATETARARIASAVGGSKPVGLSISFARDPTQPGAALTGSLNLTNNTGSSLLLGYVDVRVPLLVSAFTAASLSGCSEGIAVDGLCNPLELDRWIAPGGFLAAGATTTVSMPLTVLASGVTNGQLTYLDVHVSDTAGRPLTAQSRTALVAPFVDVDSDNVADSYDNCPVFANPDQRETDLDGRGDLCECTDQNGDGRNTVSDIVAINTAIFNPAQVTPLCDGNNDGLCNVNDIIAANIEIFSPTSTSTCARQAVPGP